MNTFDTHAAVNALRHAGIEEPQAEAIVNTNPPGTALRGG